EVEVSKGFNWNHLLNHHGPLTRIGGALLAEEVLRKLIKERVSPDQHRLWKEIVPYLAAHNLGFGVALAWNAYREALRDKQTKPFDNHHRPIVPKILEALNALLLESDDDVRLLGLFIHR